MIALQRGEGTNPNMCLTPEQLAGSCDTGTQCQYRITLWVLHCVAPTSMGGRQESFNMQVLVVRRKLAI
jgi:hypothetical protein